MFIGTFFVLVSCEKNIETLPNSEKISPELLSGQTEFIVVINPNGKRDRIEVPSKLAATLESKVVDLRNANARYGTDLCYSTTDVKRAKLTVGASAAWVWTDGGGLFLAANTVIEICLTPETVCNDVGYTCYIENYSSHDIQIEEIGIIKIADAVPSNNYILYDED